MRMSLAALVVLFIPAFTVSANAETKWSGGASWRHLITVSDDGLATRNASNQDTSKTTNKRHQLRADLNASGKGEVWDWGVGFRTYSSANSEWLTLQQNSDPAVNLENAYFRPHYELGGIDVAVTIGRAKSVVFFDPVGQALFDKDNRFDGFGWQFQHENFGFNATQYILGARSQTTALGSSSFTKTEASQANAGTPSGFGVLYSFQPHAKIKVSDEIEAMFAVGYHLWSGTGGSATFENAVHGGTAGTVGNVNPVILDNPRQWQILTDWSLPYGLRFVGEYIQNKETFFGTRGAGGQTSRKAQTGALALTLAYGKVKKANDWTLAYSYVRKGIAASVNTFSNGNMPGDNIGHLINAGYAIADGLSLGAKVELYREKAKVGGDGLALASPNQNRRQTQDRYEFLASVAF